MMSIIGTYISTAAERPEMVQCPFCGVAGRPPRHLLTSYERCFVLLDRESLGFGHCLVVPVVHRPTLYDLPRPDHDAVFAAARSFAPRLAAATGSRAVGYVAFGTGLPHAHLHLVPMSDAAVLTEPRPRQLGEDELAAQAGRLRLALGEKSGGG